MLKKTITITKKRYIYYTYIYIIEAVLRFLLTIWQETLMKPGQLPSLF